MGHGERTRVGGERERIARDRPRRAIEGVWVGKSHGLDRGGVAARGSKARMLLWTRYL